jgi:cytochrome c553
MKGTMLASSKRLRCAGGLLLALLPLAVHGNSAALREFDTVIHSSPSGAHGAQLYATCAACHGVDGAGTRDGTVPALAAQHFRVVAGELVDFRHNNRRDPRMEHFTDEHHLVNAQDIADVAAFISGLKPAPNQGSGDGRYLERGGRVFARSCASCHGATAAGDDRKRYPRLAGQHADYLLHRMQGAAADQRSNFTLQHLRLIRQIEPADLAGVADYLSRLGPR